MSTAAPLTPTELGLDLVAVRAKLNELRSYVVRGRSLRQMASRDLVARWTALMREWADDVLSRPDELDDVEAELFLRDEKPPHAPDLWAVIRERVQAKHDALSPADQAEIAAELIGVA